MCPDESAWTSSALVSAISARFASPQQTQTRSVPSTITTMSGDAINVPSHGAAAMDTSAAVADQFGNNPLGGSLVGSVWTPEALKITTPADATTASVRNTAALTGGPFNVTGKVIELWVKVDHVENMTGVANSGVKLYLISDAPGTITNFNFVELVASGATYRPVQNNEWVKITCHINDFSVGGGAFNPASVQQWQINATSLSGTVVNVWIGGIRFRNANATGYVSFAFDDGDVSIYNAGRPKLDQYGYPATLYPICDQIDLAPASGYMTLAQLQELQNLHEWEIGVHARYQANHDLGWPTVFTSPAASTPPPPVGMNPLAWELYQAKLWQQGNGLSRGIDHHATPEGAYDLANVLPILRQYFHSARTVTQFYNETIRPYDPHRMRCLPLSSSTTTASVATAVTQAKNNGTWLIILAHRILPATSRTTDYTVANFNTIVDNVATQVVPVKTVGDVLRLAAP